MSGLRALALLGVLLAPAAGAQTNTSPNAPESSRPVPDPTILTTEQLNRAITSLRELIEARLAGNDKAIELLQTSTDTIPDYVKGEVRKLQELHEEKFASIATQFEEREVRADQTLKDSKVAIQDLFTAAKEAVAQQQEASEKAIAKNEASITKQLDAIAMLIATTNKGVDDKIDDLKSRLTTIEGMASGGSSSNATTFAVIAAIASVVAVLAGLAALARGRV